MIKYICKQCNKTVLLEMMVFRCPYCDAQNTLEKVGLTWDTNN